jgi:hypothetical protein
VKPDIASSLRKLNLKDLKLAKVPIHPFVFAALPVITSLYEVKKLVLPEEVIPCLMVLETTTAILLVVSMVLLKSVTKGAIITTLAIGLFFSYRLLAYAIEAASTALTGHTLPPWVTLVLYALLSAVCLISSLKEDWDFGKIAFKLDLKRLNLGLNFISVALLVMNSVSLVSFEMEDEANSQKYVTRYKTAFDTVALNSNLEKPDVYYFIVDGFANRLTMNDMYGIHDDYLYDFLTKHGFYVVPKARSNYDRTEFSVSSTFNMQYVNGIPDELGKDYDGLNLFCRMIQDSAVRRTFKRLGYTIVNVSSGTSATDWMYTADKNIRRVPFNHFMTAVALLTPLYAAEQYSHLTRDLLADMRLCPGDSMTDIFNIPGPKFVLIHTDIAHAPCIFDETGKRLPLPEGQYMINWGTPAELGAQWKFAQKVLVDWLTKVIDASHGKAVIIMQSDHGSGIPMPKTGDWYNERMRIINALYLPGKSNANCYETMTPVNNFRVFFDDYFDAKLPMLPDKSWCAPVYTKPFDWIDVQDKLDFKK